MMFFEKFFALCISFYLVLNPTFSSAKKKTDIHSLYFEVISSKDKLPNSIIKCIDQDSLGFLWFGSNDGVFRYDGQNFQIYRNIVEDPSSLSVNYISDMHLDHSGNPWILTYQSLDFLDQHSGKFRHFYIKPTTAKNIDLGSSSQFTITPENNIFITSTFNGLFFLANNDSIIQYLENDKAKFPVLGSDIETIAYQNHYIYVGKKNDGLYRIQLSKNNCQILQVEKIPNTESNQTFIIYPDKKERIWVGTSNGIILFDQQSGTTYNFRFNINENFFLPDKEILSLFVDDDDNLWIGSRENGLSVVSVSEIYKKGDKAVGTMYSSTSTEGNLSNRCINKIFKDRDGNFWLGTYSGGLHFISDQKNKIHSLKFIPGHPDSPSYPKIWGIAQSKDGDLWLGTDGGGIDVWNPTRGIVKRIKYKPGEKGLTDNAILCALNDTEGFIWVGTYRGGVNRIDPKTGIIKTYKQIPSSVNGKFTTDIRCLYQDSKGKIWIGTNWEGVCYFDRKSDSFVNIKELGNIDVRSIIESKLGGYWIATLSRGLFWYNPNTKEQRNFRVIPGDFNNSLPSNDIYCLKEDKQGKLWIGTQYGGLSSLDLQSGKFKNFNQGNGLANNTVLSILEDARGYIWLSTNEGISRFDPTSEKFINYDQTNGVLPGEFLNGSCLSAKDGTFYFGGSNGLNYFRPNFIQPSDVTPSVVFTGLKIFNERISPGKGVINTTMEFNPLIKLNYKQTVFTIEFQAIQYPFANKCQYQYMLEGYDEKWNHSGINNSATYRQLPAGDYNFKVKATNSDGIENETTASIRIKIVPPFWKTIWAYLIYFVLLAGLVHTFFRFRMKQIKMANQLQFEQKIRLKEQKIHHERLEFFTNISHELRTPLTLIECAIDDLKKLLSKTKSEKITESIKTASFHSSRLLELINQLLEFRRIETGTPQISVEEISLNQWIADYLQNFKELADNRSISLKLAMPVNTVKVWADIDKFAMIMNNLLSNAFKHTPKKGTINVNIEETNKSIIIELSDTGFGISPNALPFIFDRYFKTGNSSTSTGIGLSLTQSLVELHHGSISVSSILGKGSKFTINLPKGNQHFKPEQIKIQVIEDQKQESIQNTTQRQTYDLNNERKIMLIIEDNPDISTLLAGKFTSTFDVHVTEDGQEGIDVAGKLIPDIIISDIMMPGIQGTEVCKILKTKAETSHIPIILLTAKGTINDELVGLNTGADDYISKPFNFQILEARVKTLIKNRSNLFNYFQGKTKTPPTTELGNKLLEQEQKFLQKAEQLILDKYLDSESSVFKLAEDLNFSRSSLYRKIKMLTGLSINEFVRSVKIRNVMRLIEEGEKSISEAAYNSGFNDLKYFREIFIKQTGETPSTYKNRIQKRIN